MEISCQIGKLDGLSLRMEFSVGTGLSDPLSGFESGAKLKDVRPDSLDKKPVENPDVQSGVSCRSP